jgi:hypothetical protein
MKALDLKIYLTFLSKKFLKILNGVRTSQKTVFVMNIKWLILFRKNNLYVF